MTETSLPVNQSWRAAGWMMGAVAAFTLMAVAGRMVSHELGTFEILAYRSLIGVAILALVLTVQRRWRLITLARADLHLARNISHFIAQNLWFHALFTIPLAQVFAFEFTAPLWVLLLSPLLLGEKLTGPRLLAAGLGFAGALMVAQPGGAGISSGVISAAAAAIGFALTYICTKKLTAVTHPLCILWWMSVSQAVMGFACAAVDGGISMPSAAALPWIAVLGGTGLGAHFCVTSALRLAPATVVMPFDFLRLPVIAIVGLVLYGEPIGVAVVIGAALIVMGNFVNLRAKPATT